MIEVLVGVAAVKFHNGWCGLTPRGYCDKYRRTADAALKDAKRHEAEAATEQEDSRPALKRSIKHTEDQLSGLSEALAAKKQGEADST